MGPPLGRPSHAVEVVEAVSVAAGQVPAAWAAGQGLVAAERVVEAQEVEAQEVEVLVAAGQVAAGQVPVAEPCSLIFLNCSVR